MLIMSKRCKILKKIAFIGKESNQNYIFNIKYNIFDFQYHNVDIFSIDSEQIKWL